MSSFRKRNVQKPIPGTRTSPQTGQTITSSGNPSLDLILGGGLPIGSICLIEEDKYVTFSKVLAKYFLAEGILSKQPIFLGSLDDDPNELLHKLPKPLNDEEVEQEEEKSNGEEAPKNGLRIAWRYNDLPLVNSEQTTIKIGHHFNLLEPMNLLQVESAEIAIWNDATQSEAEESDASTAATAEEDEDERLEPMMQTTSSSQLGKQEEDLEMFAQKFGQAEAMELDAQQPLEATEPAAAAAATTPTAAREVPRIFENPKYLQLLQNVQALLPTGEHFNIVLGRKRLHRICITSLGSPLWYDEHFAKDILKFLTVLRASVRSTLTVCFITLPMHLVAKCDETLVSKIRNLVDYAIELESFAGSERETNPAFKEYNGLLHLHKITAINTLSAYQPETTDLAFKLRRKKFVIEKLHLPPELQESGDSAAANPETMPSLSCSSGGGIGGAGANSKPSLDF